MTLQVEEAILAAPAANIQAAPRSQLSPDWGFGWLCPLAEVRSLRVMPLPVKMGDIPSSRNFNALSMDSGVPGRYN